MGVKLVSSSAGSVELVAPVTASNFTATMPVGTGSVVVNGVNSSIVSGTAVASTSGTSIDFTSIPSWVKRITVMFYRISTNGSSQIILQLGSGSVATSGYNTRITSINGSSGTNANGMGNAFGVISSGNAAPGILCSGQIVFSLLGSNNWCGCGSTMDNTQQNVQWVQSGDVPLSGTLDRLRVTTANGTDTFDAGSINILYE